MAGMINEAKRLVPQILRLLSRTTSQPPAVKVGPSTLPTAGRGVFAARPIELGEAVCLYPGVYAAGLPLSINVDEVEFLGSLTTPSGIPTEENAYVLNLAETGGYIDGRALLDPDGRRLDENPSACGHLLNHNVDQANVRVVSFLWKDLLEGTPAVDSKEYFSLPNVVRSDGALRYRLGSEMVYYHNKDSPACAGAVFCATTNIKTGQEFFLDYGLLQRPLPSWASDWYEKE